MMQVVLFIVLVTIVRIYIYAISWVLHCIEWSGFNMHWMVFNTITALFPPNFKGVSFLSLSSTVVSLFLLRASRFISCAHRFTLPTRNRLLLFGLHCSSCWMKEKMDSLKMRHLELDRTGRGTGTLWTRVGSSSCPQRGTVPWYMNRMNILEELEMLKDSQCFRTVSYSDNEIVLFSFIFYFLKWNE